MSTIGVLGSIAIDHIFQAETVPTLGQRVLASLIGRHVGGMAVNQAMEAARFTPDVQILGKVGADGDGRELLQELRARGIGTELLLTDPVVPTGKSFMYLVGKDYFSVVAAGANTSLTSAEAQAAVERLGSGRLIVSLEIPEEAVAAALSTARRRGIETVLVASPAERCMPEFLTNADWVIVNRREAQILFGLYAATMDETAKEVGKLPEPLGLLVTLSEEGAVLRVGANIYCVTAFPVESVDPVGAGDALTGAFVAALSQGLHPKQALEIACVAGAFAVATVGAQSSQHSSSQLMQLAEQHYSTTSMEALQ